jgi:hypothetical protein
MDVITEEMAQNLVFLTMSRNAIYHGEAEEIPTELVDFARTVREQLEGLMRSS